MSSANRAWSSLLARRCSKGWPAVGRSSPRRSEARRNSCPQRQESSSTHSTSRRLQRRCARPRSFPARTRPPAPRPSGMTSMSRRAGWRRFCSPLEIGEPDLHQRPDRILEPGLARDYKSLLVALPNLRRIDPLLQPVVTCDEQLLDPLARVLGLHDRSLTAQSSVLRKTNG